MANLATRKDLRKVFHVDIKGPVQMLQPFSTKKSNDSSSDSSSSSSMSSSMSTDDMTPSERKVAFKHFRHMVRQTLNNKVSSRVFRLCGILFVPLTLIGFMEIYREKITVNEIFGYALLFMFIVYFIHLFLIFTGVCTCRRKKDTDSLFRIYSLNSIVPGWTPMVVSYGALMFKHQPIQSISEFSAINGGIAHVMLLIISSYSWVVLLCALAPEIHEFGLSVLSIGDIFEFCGCFGLVMIGTFELDPWSKTMRWFHNTGAMIGSLTLFGFLYQQYIISMYENNTTSLYLPIALTLTAIIAYSMWNYYSNKANNFDAQQYKTSKKTDNSIQDEIKISKNVTYISFGNVISEAIVLLCGATSMCLWLTYFDYCHKYNHCRPLSAVSSHPPHTHDASHMN